MAIDRRMVRDAQPRRLAALVGDSTARFVRRAVWVAALFGNTVVWRGKRLRIDRDGRIQVN